jgi:hypothetical protein
VPRQRDDLASLDPTVRTEALTHSLCAHAAPPPAWESLAGPQSVLLSRRVAPLQALDAKLSEHLDRLLSCKGFCPESPPWPWGACADARRLAGGPLQ